MHYVPGHEVGAYITKEVHNLAHSTSVPWQTVREEGSSGSYVCRVGDVVAVKIVEVFDCSPATLLDSIDHVVDSGAGQAQVVILDEYDKNNQIILTKLQFAALQKLARCCVYRYKCVEHNPLRYYVAYQSVEHDAVPETDEFILLTYAPTGFEIQPIPGEEGKCKMFFISQIVDLEQKTSREFLQSYFATAGGLGRLFQDIMRQISTNCFNNSVVLPTRPSQVEALRRDSYGNYYDLISNGDWKLVERKWYEAFVKEEDPHVYVAMRATTFSSDSCKQVAARVYDAIRTTCEWNMLILRNEVLEEIDEGSCILLQDSQGFNSGAVTRLICLVACRVNMDGTCDVTWQSIDYDYKDKNPAQEVVILQCDPSACIISPNGQGTTIHWILRLPRILAPAVRIPIARGINFLTGVNEYILANTSSSIVPRAAGSEFMNILNPLSTQLKGLDLEVKQKKRKASSSALALVKVENIVLKMPPGEQPVRPFLFLVANSNEGQVHRFVRRRWHSPVSQSIFDVLPREILELVFSFLDPMALLFTIPRVCNQFKEFMESTAVWKRLYKQRWGPIVGRLQIRYCGDEDPESIFTSSFAHWKEVFWEKQQIELAWQNPEVKVHGFRVVSGHSRTIRSVVLSNTCNRILTGSLDKLIRLWDTHSGTCMGTVSGGSGVIALQLEQKHLKAGYKGGIVRYFETAYENNGRDVRYAESMRGCIFADNSVVTWDDDVEMWDENTQQRLKVFNGHTSYISECVISNNNSVLYSSSRDKTVRLWDLKGGTRIAMFSGHTRGVTGVAQVSEYTFGSVSSDKSLRIWDTRKTDHPMCVRTEHTGKIKCIKASANGKKICTGGVDGVHVWNSDTFEHIRWDPSEQVDCIAVDDERMAYGAAGGVVRYYDFVPRQGDAHRWF